MTVTSTNHNPGNDSKYARHRSIWKGSHNQLRRTIASFQGTQGMTVHEYLGSPHTVDSGFNRDWGLSLTIKRVAAKGRQVQGTWSNRPPTAKLLGAVGGLQSDLKLLWNDFMEVAARRIGYSDGMGSNVGSGASYNSKSLLVFAAGPNSFDLIVSKYGFGDDQKKNHHFYQWQARGAGFTGLVNVDDYTNEEEGLTFYVVA